MQQKRTQVNKNFFKIKILEYRGGIKARKQDGDDHVNVIQLDDSNSQALLACVYISTAQPTLYRCHIITQRLM